MTDAYRRTRESNKSFEKTTIFSIDRNNHTFEYNWIWFRLNLVRTEWMAACHWCKNSMIIFDPSVCFLEMPELRCLAHDQTRYAWNCYAKNNRWSAMKRNCQAQFDKNYSARFRPRLITDRIFPFPYSNTVLQMRHVNFIFLWSATFWHFTCTKKLTTFLKNSWISASCKISLG